MLRSLPVVFILFFCLQGQAKEISDQPALVKPRQVVKSLHQQLGSKLKAALSKGGPPQAIEVCRSEAQSIAKRVGKAYGVTVKRISDKPRNPSDKPDEMDAAVLQQFASDLAADGSATMERLVKLANGKSRYYKGIRIQSMCLTCHGENLSAQVRQTLQEYYPEDKATGYQMGDLRGAFVVEL